MKLENLTQEERNQITEEIRMWEEEHNLVIPSEEEMERMAKEMGGL